MDKVIYRLDIISSLLEKIVKRHDELDDLHKRTDDLENKLNSCIENSNELWNTRHSPWISVNYNLPENGTNVLSYSKGGGISTCLFMKNNDSEIFILMPSFESVNDDSLVIRLTNVTHWMPLPKPPKETE